MEAQQVETLLHFCRVTVLSVAQRNRDRTFLIRVWLLFEAFCDPTLVTASLFVETLHFDRQLLLDIPRARRTTLLQPHDSAALDASETSSG